MTQLLIFILSNKSKRNENDGTDFFLLMKTDVLFLMVSGLLWYSGLIGKE